MNSENNSTWGPKLSTAIMAALFGYMLLIRWLPFIAIDHDLHFGAWYVPWSYTPALALFMYAGARYSQKSIAYLMPLALYLLGDLGIWAISGRLDWAFYPGQWAVYCCLIFCALVGTYLSKKPNVGALITLGMLANLVYFAATNFAVWAQGDWYPHTWAGLAQCYVAALPYFRNMVAGTAFFSLLLFMPHWFTQPFQSEVSLQEEPA